MTFLNNCKITKVLDAVAAGQAASATDIIDMEGFTGVCFIASLGDVTAASVVTLAAQQNTINSTSGMATLVGSVTHTASATDADNTLMILDVVNPNEQFVRAVFTSATQNAVKNGVYAIQYGAKDSPVTQGSTVLEALAIFNAAEA